MATSEKSQVSLRLPTRLVEDVDRVATVLDRDRTWIIQRALQRYLDEEGAEILEDAAGIAELDRGQGVDADEVLRKAYAIIAAAEGKRVPRAG